MRTGGHSQQLEGRGQWPPTAWLTGLSCPPGWIPHSALGASDDVCADTDKLSEGAQHKHMGSMGRLSAKCDKGALNTALAYGKQA